jgi:predicted DNA-binding transcriptional regulator AlpA
MVYLTATQVRQRFGGISDMTLWRWMHDERVDFPAPVVINRRRYFRLPEVEAFEDRQTGQTARTAAA